jgi:hypothetical protein
MSDFDSRLLHIASIESCSDPSFRIYPSSRARGVSRPRQRGVPPRRCLNKLNLNLKVRSPLPPHVPCSALTGESDLIRGREDDEEVLEDCSVGETIRRYASSTSLTLSSSANTDLLCRPIRCTTRQENAQDSGRTSLVDVEREVTRRDSDCGRMGEPSRGSQASHSTHGQSRPTLGDRMLVAHSRSVR